MDLNGKTAVVTGGTGGLGKCICQTLFREGANLAIAYLKAQDEANQLTSELCRESNKSIPSQADVTRQFGIDIVVNNTIEAFRKLDILVNTAGTNNPIPFADLIILDEQDIQQLLMQVEYSSARGLRFNIYFSLPSI